MNSSVTSSLAPLRSSTVGTVSSRMRRSPSRVTSDDVLVVEGDHLGTPQAVAAAHGDQTGYPRAGRKDALVQRAVAFDHHDEVGPRPDEAHVAEQHVEQLRQLVEAGGAQPAAGRRDARVALFEVEAVAHRDGVGDHGAELEDAKDPAMAADPFLTEEDGPAAGRVDDGGQCRPGPARWQACPRPAAARSNRRLP